MTVAAKVMPADWSLAKRCQKDVEALWAKKHGESYFGYKLSAIKIPYNILLQILAICPAPSAVRASVEDVVTHRQQHGRLDHPARLRPRRLPQQWPIAKR